MKRYFYHGIGELMDIEMIDIMQAIIDSGGLKTRSYVNRHEEDSDYEEFNHICLYKKNEDFDYDSEDAMLKTARGGWIDHCFYFIISPDIEAEKTEVVDETSYVYNSSEKHYLKTNLVDEWRYNGNIPLDKIVGIAIPFDSLKEYIEEFPGLSKEYDEKINRLLTTAESLGWRVENSDDQDLCDKLDEELQTKATEVPTK